MSRRRYLLQLMVLLVGVWANDAARAAVPAVPQNCRAVPDYTNAAIIVEWDDVAGETGYRVFRGQHSSGPFDLVSEDIAADTTTWTDPDRDPAQEYFYQVRAFNTDGIGGASNVFQQNIKVLWPNPGNLTLLHNWNDTLGVAGSGGAGYHKGIDLQQTGSSKDDIFAPRGGRVVRAGNQGWDNNHIYIEVREGDQLRYDSFNHLNGETASSLDVEVGDYVYAGQFLARIGDDYFTCGTVDFVDHTHFFIPSDAFTNEVDGQNPLKIFVQEQERDPQNVRPGIFDHTGDGTVRYHRQWSPAGPPYLVPPLGDDPLTLDDEGNVDIHIEIADDQNGGAGTTQVPVRLSYWIEGRACDGGQPAVKDATTPYTLFDWHDEFYRDEGVEWRWIVDQAADLAPLISYDGVDYPDNWDNFKSFVITNASGTTGAPSDIQTAQYWNTNAADDGSTASVAHANFTDLPDASRAADARFPDGEYSVHVISEDLLGQRAEVVRGVLVENFAPAVAAACASDGQLQPGQEFLRLRFSEPMERSAVESALSLTQDGQPFSDVSIVWDDNDCLLDVVIGASASANDAFTANLDAVLAVDKHGRTLDADFGSQQHNGIEEGAADSVQVSFRLEPAPAVSGVSLASIGSSATQLSWSPSASAASYSITRGDLGLLSTGQYGACLIGDLQGTTYEDNAVPRRNNGFAYLIQANSVLCETSGSLGADSSGQPRVNLDPAACP